MSKLALVTGASSGIGQAFAERLAADGYDLVVVGRRRDRLEELAASHPDVDGADRWSPTCPPTTASTRSPRCARREPLTMLVNNAGVAHYMPLAELPADKARELVHVKVVAPTMLTRAAVPGMLARGEGTIINVAGMIAFSGPAPQPQLPRRAVYAGTLAHLVAMSQTLHAELEGTGVRVQVVCPGVVATEFHERQGLDLSAVPRMSAAGRRHRQPARPGTGRGRLRARRRGRRPAGGRLRGRPRRLRRAEPRARRALPGQLTSVGARPDGHRAGPHRPPAVGGHLAGVRGPVRPGRASSGCWCMYPRIGPEYRRRPRSANKQAMNDLAVSGRPPGLVAFSGAAVSAGARLHRSRNSPGSPGGVSCPRSTTGRRGRSAAFTRAARTAARACPTRLSPPRSRPPRRRRPRSCRPARSTPVLPGTPVTCSPGWHPPSPGTGSRSSRGSGPTGP